MNIYEKVATIKMALLQVEIKKTGRNEFAKFDYYELSDIIPTILKLCNDNKVLVKVSFDRELATATAINLELPNETYLITMPMEKLEIKGANSVQALGGATTYMRRYLLLTMFDLVETELFDKTMKGEDKTGRKKTVTDFDKADFPPATSVKSKSDRPMDNTLNDKIKRIEHLLKDGKVNMDSFNGWLVKSYKTSDLYLLPIEDLIVIEKEVVRVTAKKSE